MRNVEIEVFPIAHTKVDREAVKKWMEFLGANEFEIPDEGTITDPALLVALGGKRCYNSFQPGLNPNVTKIRSDWAEYIDNILKSGHGSVIEHAVWTFSFENVSRVFTGEMNRHRAGVAISEGSMRYIRFDPILDENGQPKPDTGIAWWMPLSIRPSQEYGTALNILDQAIEDKKAKSREVFNLAFRQMEQNYCELLKSGEEEMSPTSAFAQKKQLTSAFRRIIGMGVASGGVWSMNIRAVRHIMGMRATPHAEEEIAYVFSKVAKIIVEAEPMLMGDFEQDKDGFWKPKYWKV